jgi:Ca2+-transporting ATPase
LQLKLKKNKSNPLAAGTHRKNEVPPEISMAVPVAGFAHSANTGVSQRNGTQALAIPVHTAVKGRLRLHVPYLLGSNTAKVVIEQEFSSRIPVSHVSANPVTGNVLVLFDPLVKPKRIVKTLEEIVEDFNTNGSRWKHVNTVTTERSTKRATLVRSASSGLTPQDQGRPWHVLDADEALVHWKTSTSTGLSATTVQERLRKYGPNTLAEAERRSIITMVLEQFHSLPVLLLMGSAALSILTGGVGDAAVILAVVLINAGIGAATEYQAEKTIYALTRGAQSKVLVLRNGALQRVSQDQIVPGDILSLSPGEHVPADCRLIETKNLRTNEATLTGESFPVKKSAARLAGSEIPIGDRVNMVYRGTVVTGGGATAVAVTTGRRTEIGNIQALMSDTKPPDTPMQRQLDQLGKRMVYLSGAACGAVFLLGLARGYGFLQMLKSVVALAVAAVPEGLPTVATTTLSLGIRKMRREGVLIRHLDAVETLGAVQVLCLDKTGTLTQSRMAVQRLFCGMRRITVTDDRFILEEKEVNPYEHQDLLRLIHTAVLCNEVEVQGDNGHFTLNGSATEGALMQMAITAGVAVNSLRAQYTKIRVDYRTEGRNFMSVLFRAQDDGFLLAVKGNPQEVLARCRWLSNEGSRCELTADMRAAILHENEKLAGEALRVLGFAYSRSTDADQNLIWLGLAGLADPVRDGVEQLLQSVQKAGIRTVMITGDQSATAYAISKRIKLSGTDNLEMLDSSHIERLDPQLLTALAPKVDVFSRVSPGHKLRIVQGLQNSGQVVAMTGDGINDGPALKAADIGIAMGSEGTEAARSVADVVLENDDLQTLVVAIGEGRTIYNNIRKSLHFLMSTNLSEILLMLGSVGAGLGQPLNPMQLLWINLLTDVFPALALSVELPEPDVLTKPPRDPETPIISNADLKRYGFESFTITASTMATYAYAITRYGLGPQASTVAFMNLTLAQLLHAYSCRSERRAIGNAGLRSNPYLHLSVGGSLLLQIATIVAPPLRRLLGLAPLGWPDMLAVAGGTVLPFVLNEATKGMNWRGTEER